MGRSEGHLGGRICVGGEGAVRVLQGFGALRPQEATQREELQSPSGPLSLEGLWGEDRLPAGVGAAFPKPVSAGLHGYGLESREHSVLGPALVLVAMRRWTQTVSTVSLSHVLCGNRANAPSVTSHRRWGCESMRATKGRVFSATLQGDTEVAERGGRG